MNSSVLINLFYFEYEYDQEIIVEDYICNIQSRLSLVSAMSQTVAAKAGFQK